MGKGTVANAYSLRQKYTLWRVYSELFHDPSDERFFDRGASIFDDECFSKGSVFKRV